MLYVSFEWLIPPVMASVDWPREFESAQIRNTRTIKQQVSHNVLVLNTVLSVSYLDETLDETFRATRAV